MGLPSLSLMNATGGFVAPVIDARTDPVVPRSVRVALDVAGYLALTDVGPNLWLGNMSSNQEVRFGTSDCTGPGYISSGGAIAESMVPLTVAAGSVPGAQVLHVADVTAIAQTLTMRAYRSPNGPGCVAHTPYIDANLLPVVATLDLSTLGPPPYRVVRTP